MKCLQTVLKIQLSNISTCFFKALLLLTLFSAFYSCQEDEILDEGNKKSYELKTSRVSINQVINEISSSKIKQNLQPKNYISLNASLLRTSDSTAYFIKKEKDNELTTYILHLNSYSQSIPYFLKLIITKNQNEPEKIGYLKYIPTSPTEILDMATFSGEVQILNTDFEITATSEYINGIKVNNQSNGTFNKMICRDEIVLTEVKCSYSGNHGVGEICTNGKPNDAYYLVSIFTRCNSDRDTPTQIIEDTGNGGNGGGFVSLTVYLNGFINDLDEDELTVYYEIPAIQEYLTQNIIAVPNPNYNPLLGGNPIMIIIRPEVKEFAKELLEDLSYLAIPNISIDNNAVKFIIETHKQNKIYNDISEYFLVSVDTLVNIETATVDPIVLQQLSIHFTIQCAVLKYNHPDWPKWRIHYEASKELIHITLDAFGLVPVIGEVADLTNGILYTIEGDGVNATLSYASAVPFAGWAAVGVKYAFKVKQIATIGTKVKLTWKVVGNTIDFGSSNQLRKVLGLAVGNPNQAHHIIPWAYRGHPAVQKAAKSGNAFHMNEALNGIPLSTAVHNGSHNNYNNLVEVCLDAIPNNATPDQAYNAINTLINNIRTAIQNNPTTPINQLSF